MHYRIIVCNNYDSPYMPPGLIIPKFRSHCGAYLDLKVWKETRGSSTADTAGGVMPGSKHTPVPVLTKTSQNSGIHF